ncbi:MAG: amino acid permease [Kiritimatiellae bacterium]|nr:amino acid permease [Kiritimatiellia bacterium]
MKDSPVSRGGSSARPQLGAYLAPLAVVALSFGYAVGWGSFVMPGTTFLPGAGPAGTAIGILLGAAAMSVFAFNYHRMLQRCPGPGGALAFATRAFGADHGFLIAWFLWLTYVAILWANATALVLLARYLFGDALQFGFHYTMAGFDVYFGEVALCVLAIVLCGAVCLYGKRAAAGLNTFLAVAFVVGVATVFAAALLRHEGGFAAMAPAFSSKGGSFVQVVHILSMIPWAFVGFEAVVHSSGEFRFPVRRAFVLMAAAIAVSAAVYLLLALLPVVSLPDGYATWSDYIAALPGLKGMDAMPVFAASRKALGAAGVAIVGGTMLAAQLTGMFGTLVASSRLMLAMAKEGDIPSVFGRLNRDGTPANAVLFVTCASCAIPFLGRTVTGWPVDVSNLGAAIAYGYTSAAAFALARKETGRAALAGRVAGAAGVAMAAGFCLLMLVPDFLSGETLSAESYLVLTLWCLLGFLQYRHVFLVDWLARFGKSTVVWIGVLVMIFFSSLMWIRLAVCDASESAFGSLVGKTVDAETVSRMMASVGGDMLSKMLVEMLLLLSSLAVIINLFSILRRREQRLLQQKLEAEESAGKSRSYFFSTVSHDIRTPLNAIVGFSEMMKAGFKTEEERKQAVDSILAGGKSLLKLVDGALDFTKLESGELKLAPAPTEVSKLADEIVESFRASNKNASLELRCKASGLPSVMVDPQRVGQILHNFVGNAVKFTKSGFVEVRASFAADSGTLRIEVEDTGCGIGEEDAKRIMSPYVQVDSKESRHGGTGLGLALCRQLATAMGGEISVVSALGKGSTFAFELPAVKVCAAPEEPRKPKEPEKPEKPEVPAPPETTEKPQPPAPPAPAKRLRILIVDDQKMNLTVLKAMLRKLGDFDVATAADGKQALEALEASGGQPFDMVLTDMWMPEMDGKGLVKAIRASERLRSLPVHVVTADVEMLGRHEEAGFTGIVIKPVTMDKLRDLLPA